MKSLEMKRDELAQQCQNIANKDAAYGYSKPTTNRAFKYGWDACAKEYDAVLEDTKLKIEGDFRDEIKKLKRQVQIVKNCLNQIMAQFDDYDDDGERFFYYCYECNSAEFVEKALKELESAGE